MSIIATESPPTAPQPDAGGVDVIGPYLERVRAQIDALPPAQRLPFICEQRANWLTGYALFERRMAKGKKPEPGETAATYIIGIAELGKLRAAEEAKCAVIPVEA